jgi:hypothetical protein
LGGLGGVTFALGGFVSFGLGGESFVFEIIVDF